MGCRASPCPNFGPGTDRGIFGPTVNEGYARGGCPGRVSITGKRCRSGGPNDGTGRKGQPFLRRSTNYAAIRRNREPRLLVLCAVCRECPGVNRILDT